MVWKRGCYPPRHTRTLKDSHCEKVSRPVEGCLDIEKVWIQLKDPGVEIETKLVLSTGLLTHFECLVTQLSLDITGRLMSDLGVTNVNYRMTWG